MNRRKDYNILYVCYIHYNYYSSQVKINQLKYIIIQLTDKVLILNTKVIIKVKELEDWGGLLSTIMIKEKGMRTEEPIEQAIKVRKLHPTTSS